MKSPAIPRHSKRYRAPRERPLAAPSNKKKKKAKTTKSSGARVDLGQEFESASEQERAQNFSDDATAPTEESISQPPNRRHQPRDPMPSSTTQEYSPNMSEQSSNNAEVVTPTPARMILSPSKFQQQENDIQRFMTHSSAESASIASESE
jgi:phage repressor protein C with HTH and peptisase S24 domain